MDFLHSTQRGQEPKRVAQDRHADLRAVRNTGHCRSIHSSSLAGCGACGPGHRRAPGMVGQLVHSASDMFPKAAVGSVIGIGGMSGAIGGALLQLATGYIVKITNSYVPLFVAACSAYLLALIIIHFITPRLAPAKIDL